MAMDGKNILVLADTGAGVYAAVAEQTNVSWESTTNLISADSKDSDHTKWIPGKKDDTLSLEAAYVPDDTAYQAIKDAKAAGTSVILRRSESGVEVEEAEAFVSTISGEGPDNDKATISIEFQLNEDWATVSAT